MRPIRLLFATLFLLCTASAIYAQKQDERFPTDDEILLVLTQAERAVGEYKPLLNIEEKMFAKTGVEALAKDRETVHGIDVAIAAFKKNPQEFNGPFGFAFFEWLDDACRNALLSSVSASSNATLSLINGDKENAKGNIELAKDLANVSTVLYTVSENAGALYARYINGEEKLAMDGAKVATDCTDLLKKRKAADLKQ